MRLLLGVSFPQVGALCHIGSREKVRDHSPCAPRRMTLGIHSVAV